MNKVTLLAILTVLPYSAIAAPDSDQGLLEAALQERAEIIERDFERKLSQIFDSSAKTPPSLTEEALADESQERSHHPRLLRLAEIITR